MKWGKGFCSEPYTIHACSKEAAHSLLERECCIALINFCASEVATYSDVVVNELRPPKHVYKSVNRSQFAPLVAFGNGVLGSICTPQIVDRNYGLSTNPSTHHRRNHGGGMSRSVTHFQSSGTCGPRWLWSRFLWFPCALQLPPKDIL